MSHRDSHPFPAEKNPAANEVRAGWIGLAVAAPIIAAYLGTFAVPLLLDDSTSIVENPSIRQLWPLTEAFAPPTIAPTAGRPLANLSFALNYALSGLAPWSYHLVNLGLHVLAALTLFGVMRRTLLGRVAAGADRRAALWLAAATALLWGTHPALTQTVTYISQRTELLMALCYLLTLYCFIRGLQGRATLWHGLSITACLLGTLCKEVIVTAPLLIWLYDRTFAAGSFRAALRRRRGYYLGLAATWLVAAWLLQDVKRRGVGLGLGISPFDYALTQGKAVTTYFAVSVWPHPLVFDHGAPVITSLAAAAPYLGVVVGLLLAVVWAWRRHPALGFAGASFFLVLAPTSSVVPVVGATVAENRLYLPLAALAALAVPVVHRLTTLRRTLALCAVAIAATSIATVARNQDYRDEIRLWSDTLAKAPDNVRAHNNLALLLAKLPDRRMEAIDHFTTALRLKPDFAEGYNNLASVLADLPDRRAAAPELYAKAIQLKPDYAEAYNNLANQWANLPERQPQAVEYYQAAIRLKPGFAGAHNNLASVLATLPGRQAEALEHARTAIRLQPDFAEAHNNLASILASQPGQEARALEHYADALRLKPDYAEAHYNLANVLTRLPNRQQEAVEHYMAAIRLKADYPDPHNNLANLLATLPGRQTEALEHYLAAIRLKPDFAGAHNNLASLLTTLPGREEEAIDHYAAAIRIQPDFAEAHNNLASLLAGRPDRRNEALEHFATAIRLQPEYAEAHNNLASALAGIPGRLEDAITHLATAIRLRPDYARAHSNLAQLLAQVPHRRTEALEHSLTAARLMADDPRAQFNAATLLEQLGRSAEAVAFYRRALALDPDLAPARAALERLQPRAAF